jgi:transposase-like protein
MVWERLVRRARSSADSLDALSDVREIRGLLDLAELSAVRDARRGGRSWTEIATRLGMTRQSAWERWRELDEHSLPAVGSGRPGAGERQPDIPVTGATVVVPDVVGLAWPSARSLLQREELHAEWAEPPAFDREPDDYVDVADQKPAAGERVARGSAVFLWLRGGPGSATVRAPLRPPPDPRARRAAIDEETGRDETY